MKKIHTLGNSLGNHNNKKSLNISHQFGDSTLADNTLAKTNKGGYGYGMGNNNLNLSSLLKQSHLLDDDGIEDLHFYFVSFNQHKQGILKQHEVVAKHLAKNLRKGSSLVGRGQKSEEVKSMSK